MYPYEIRKQIVTDMTISGENFSPDHRYLNLGQLRLWWHMKLLCETKGHCYVPALNPHIFCAYKSKRASLAG